MLGWFRPKRTDEAVAEQEIKWIQENPEPLYDYFSHTTGIHFDQKKEITTLKLTGFAKEHKSPSFSDLLSRLKSDAALLQKLINFLTVNETYFFREMDQIYYMVSEINKSSGPIRILCAPGSTGEEPYSIAIALSEAGVDMGRISILSIDINTEAIYSAQKAIYTKRSLHRLDDYFLERYFTPVGEKYHLCDTIRSKVEFKALNLFESEVFDLGKFDYLFSRNMLIYFDTIKTASAIDRLAALAKTADSLLFFGHADIVVQPAGLIEHYQGRVKFYTQT